MGKTWCFGLKDPRLVVGNSFLSMKQAGEVIMIGFQVDLCPWGSTSPDSSVPSQSQSSPSAGTAKTQSHPVPASGRHSQSQSQRPPGTTKAQSLQSPATSSKTIDFDAHKRLILSESAYLTQSQWPGCSSMSINSQNKSIRDIKMSIIL